jgi:hypothetical protein
MDLINNFLERKKIIDINGKIFIWRLHARNRRIGR